MYIIRLLNIYIENNTLLFQHKKLQTHFKINSFGSEILKISYSHFSIEKMGKKSRSHFNINCLIFEYWKILHSHLNINCSVQENKKCYTLTLTLIVYCWNGKSRCFWTFIQLQFRPQSNLGHFAVANPRQIIIRHIKPLTNLTRDTINPRLTNTRHN